MPTDIALKPRSPHHPFYRYWISTTTSDKTNFGVVRDFDGV